MRRKSRRAGRGSGSVAAFDFRRVLAFRRGAAVLVLLTVVLVVAYFLPLSTEAGRADTAYDAQELRFLELINDYRAENDLGKLVLSDDLTVAAERHNEDMGEYGFFAHDTADSSYYAPGSEPWDRMAEEGYDYNAYKGENLAAGYETAEEAFEAWKDSPSHNEAMLDGNYRVVGVSRLDVEGSPYGWYWTTDFGSFVDPSARAGGEGTSVSEEASRSTGRANAVQNGGFVSGEFWGQRAKDGAKLILRGQFVRMGGYEGGQDVVRQEITVPENGLLRFDLKVSSVGNGDSGDRFAVRLTDARGNNVAALNRFDGTDETDWSSRRADISRYAGEELYITFSARTNAEDDTYFYLDNVSVTPR